MIISYLVAKQLDRFASRSPKRARARAERLSKVAPHRAFALFVVAAEGGDVEAAFIAGERYLEGNGTLRHPASAVQWYQRAAEAGHERAQCRLAALHLFGVPESGAIEPNRTLFEPVELGEPQYHAALPWARRAAEAGAPDAQAMLGFILSSGPEDLRDPDAAFEWYRRSAEQDCPQGRLGYAIALMVRTDIEERMSAARDELLKAAKAGLPTAHYLLGVAAERGVCTALDEAEARHYYNFAAEGQITKAQVRLGLMLIEGRGGPVDALNGESWLRRAALAGDSEAAMILGNLYARGGALPPNYIEAAHWFRTAAERGHGAAARALGMLYLTGASVARDPDEAAAWFKRAAEAGNSCAQADLAALMQAGGVSTLANDPPPVHEWFERAAKQGDLVGAFNYAVCLAKGIGVPRNDERAAFWLKHAAAGLATAQYWYGRMLSEGRGLVKDDAEAAAWFARAAHAGLADAQVALGELYLSGRGVPPDHQLARSWFLRAAQAGHPTAALMLARYAASGLGGARDLEAARHWYSHAAALGVPGAADELATLPEVADGSGPTVQCAQPGGHSGIIPGRDGTSGGHCPLTRSIR